MSNETKPKLRMKKPDTTAHLMRVNRRADLERRMLLDSTPTAQASQIKTLDFNDDETRRQHQQIIAIFLANREGDDLINSARADWHIANHMAGGKPSDEAIQAAATEFLVIWEWLKAYRDFYAEPKEEPDTGGYAGQMGMLYEAGQRRHAEAVAATERRAANK